MKGRLTMELLWKNINKSNRSEKTNINIFLLCNTIFYAIIGMLVWFGVHFFTLDSIVWAFCFIGYSSFFGGFIGGAIFLYGKN